MRIPDVQFTRRDDVDIAYQTFGEGDAELVVLSEWVSNAATVWQHPGHIRNWRWQGRLGRCVRFDRSGIGASTRLSPARTASVDEWVADLLAVVDAVGFERPIIAGEGFAGHAAITFASRHPDRVAKLGLINSFIRLTADEEHPSGVDPRSVDAIADGIEHLWGTGRVTSVAPGIAGYGDFSMRFEQAACDAATAAAIVRAMYRADVSALLPALDLPVLVANTGDLRYVPSTLSRELAAAIPGAEYDEWSSTTFYERKPESDAWTRFVNGADMAARQETVAILFTDIVDSTPRAHELGARWRDVLEDIDAFTYFEVEHQGGTIVNRTGDGCLARFTDVASAVRAALRIVPGGDVLGAPIRAGVHVGVVDVRDDGDLAGVDVHIGARVAAQARGGGVLVSEAARRELGPEFVVVDAGAHVLKGMADPVQLFEVTAR